MKYSRKLILKDGRECCLRNGTKEDGGAVLENFRLVHEQTVFLLSYPEFFRDLERLQGKASK